MPIDAEIFSAASKNTDKVAIFTILRQNSDSVLSTKKFVKSFVFIVLVHDDLLHGLEGHSMAGKEEDTEMLLIWRSF